MRSVTPRGMCSRDGRARSPFGRAGRYLGAVAREFVQHLAERDEPGVGHKSLPLAPRVQRDGLAAVVAVLGHPVAASGDLCKSLRVSRRRACSIGVQCG